MKLHSQLLWVGGRCQCKYCTLHVGAGGGGGSRHLAVVTGLDLGRPTCDTRKSYPQRAL